MTEAGGCWWEESGRDQSAPCFVAIIFTAGTFWPANMCSCGGMGFNIIFARIWLDGLSWIPSLFIVPELSLRTECERMWHMKVLYTGSEHWTIKVPIVCSHSVSQRSQVEVLHITFLLSDSSNWRCWDWTWDLLPAKQMLCHWAMQPFYKVWLQHEPKTPRSKIVYLPTGPHMTVGSAVGWLSWWIKDFKDTWCETGNQNSYLACF